MTSAIDSARQAREISLERLKEFLRIPSVSTNPDHADDVVAAAQWLAERFRESGADLVRIDPTARHPVVYAECLHAPGAPTLLVYGHYDVQPAEPFELWSNPPFDPIERDGKLLARGACDDKGQLMTHVEALRAWTASGEKPPVNLKFVMEGEEEIGSPNLETWMLAHRDELAADSAVISDTSMLAPGQPSIVSGLRGLAYLEIEVTGSPGDLHSGIYGGAVRNPASALAEIIAGLHDEKGRVNIPGFYDRVRPLSDEERAEMAMIPFDLDAFSGAAGQAGAWLGEEGFSIVERLGARPTLDVNGMWSGWTGPGAKTVLPSKAYAKVSMRLVPDQDPEEIDRLFAERVKALAPSDVSVEVRALHGGHPALVERELPSMRAASRALETAFGKKPFFTREGGSIPVVALLEKTLGLQSVLLGFGLPDDNLHAPNETFSIDHYHRGIETVLHFHRELAAEVAS